ncbi:flavin reductase family protein [Sedimentitalea nanhaiensis]|uniref:NADH-FMN oxidoreductase RutF, flavin reductase (DIM6/NTAB) family n=1 Tax=Sedimentitalea nanhaiensis TaxID=999627 RepID=A0A1I7ASS6_9RHOB|nr:flavin reductase family protein [Sedimentitalea nanhaiensis]SFT78021.1 NADH-FMN oxidoreductase RutF, flavin reductase (DIM6/NTAB) family [Sedimentitalea nanhaiensis]
MSDSSFIPGPETDRAYRDALGCFGTGVTVVTTRTAQGPLAMTANSFASVSLDPPIVLWCAAKRSLRHAAFAAAPNYAIHVMANDQQDLALHFARSGHDFDTVSWTENAAGIPILRGCLARFECRGSDLHDAGDHTIIVGQVLRAACRPGTGLMYKRGQYGGFLGLDGPG